MPCVCTPRYAYTRVAAQQARENVKSELAVFKQIYGETCNFLVYDAYEDYNGVFFFFNVIVSMIRYSNRIIFVWLKYR